MVSCFPQRLPDTLAGTPLLSALFWKQLEGAAFNLGLQIPLPPSATNTSFHPSPRRPASTPQLIVVTLRTVVVRSPASFLCLGSQDTSSGLTLRVRTAGLIRRAPAGGCFYLRILSFDSSPNETKIQVDLAHPVRGACRVPRKTRPKQAISTCVIPGWGVARQQRGCDWSRRRSAGGHGGAERKRRGRRRS